jgi:hypothetical protein
MNQSLTIEELERALSIPSFEEELAQSDLPHKRHISHGKSAQIITCPICGKSTVVGPYSSYRCPAAPHDKEDDNLTDNELYEYSRRSQLEI